MAVSLLHEALMYAVYFAPRGKKRLLNLGHLLAQRHLSPLDKLIGLIGDSGAGKSLLIKGMFPGLELTNDDEGVNVRPLPLMETTEHTFFRSHTYHIDIRFESAFYEMHALVEAIKKAIDEDKRVIVEHFELIYPYLEMNAEILIGIGEEVIVTRPSVFGPKPEDIANIVFRSIKYRKMTHSAEDLTSMILKKKYSIDEEPYHSDVKHGFVLEFKNKPNIDIIELENDVKDLIEKDIIISYCDDHHIIVGDDDKYCCTGPRIHVQNTGQIVNFQLMKEFLFDPISKVYALVGVVGEKRPINIGDLNKIII